jgi:hypothetical protein
MPVRRPRSPARRRLPARAALALGAAATLGAVTAPSASATSVAYLDGGALWASTLDGSRKVQLAGPDSVPADAGAFREVAAADDGRILAVRRQDGKVSQLNWFQTVEPNGAEGPHGSLPKRNGYLSYAYPVTLDLSADGAFVAYGVSATTPGYPVGSFFFGSYVTSVASAAAGVEPIAIGDLESPSVFGNQLVARSHGDDDGVFVQAPATAPFGTAFQPWLSAGLQPGYEVRRTDVAANGAVAAIETLKWNGGTREDGGIVVVRLTGSGPLAERTPDGASLCELPAQGIAQDASLSQDGGSIAWKDDGGVKVAGAPTGPGQDGVCALSRSPVVLSATGQMPSIGGAVVDVLRPPAPAGGGGTGTPTGPGAGGSGSGTTPGATTPRLVLRLPTAKVATSTLRRGLRLRLTAPAKGTVTVVARSGSTTVARGTAKAKKAGAVSVTLRLTKTGKRRLSRLRGKTLRVTATSGKAKATGSLRVRR